MLVLLMIRVLFKVGFSGSLGTLTLVNVLLPKCNWSFATHLLCKKECNRNAFLKGVNFFKRFKKLVNLYVQNHLSVNVTLLDFKRMKHGIQKAAELVSFFWTWWAVAFIALDRGLWFFSGYVKDAQAKMQLTKKDWHIVPPFLLKLLTGKLVTECLQLKRKFNCSHRTIFRMHVNDTFIRAVKGPTYQYIKSWKLNES